MMFWLLYNRFTFEELENDEKNVFMPSHIYRRHLSPPVRKRKKIIFFIFYTCILEKDSTYHTGSAFTQQYYACCVLFVLKPILANYFCFNHQVVIISYDIMWYKLLYCASITLIKNNISKYPLQNLM